MASDARVDEWLKELHTNLTVLQTMPLTRLIEKTISLLENPPDHEVPRMKKAIRTNIVSMSVGLLELRGLSKDLTSRIKRLSTEEERKRYVEGRTEHTKVLRPIIARFRTKFPDSPLFLRGNIYDCSPDQQRELSNALTPAEIDSINRATMKRDGIGPEDLPPRCGTS